MFVDNTTLKIILSDETPGVLIDSSLESFIELPWPSLFTLLDYQDIFKNFPVFDKDHPFFTLLVSALETDNQAEIIYLYDQLFAECLTHVKNLEILEPNFIANRLSYAKVPLRLEKSLNRWKEKFTHHLKHTLHDLTLYLAWDRMCVYIAILIDNHDIKNVAGLALLEGCLIESFQHILLKGHLKMSFVRLMETMWSLKMRDEKLQTYTEEEWTILSEGAKTLTSRDKLPDLYYIEEAVVEDSVLLMSTLALSSQSEDQIKASHNLANLMMNHIKEIYIPWRLKFFPVTVKTLI